MTAFKLKTWMMGGEKDGEFSQLSLLKHTWHF